MNELKFSLCVKGRLRISNQWKIARQYIGIQVVDYSGDTLKWNVIWFHFAWILANKIFWSWYT